MSKLRLRSAGRAQLVSTVRIFLGTLTVMLGALPSNALFFGISLATGTQASTSSNFQTADPKKNGRVVLESLRLPKSIQEEVSRSKRAPDPVTHASIVARSGVKIYVNKDGFYRVKRSELQSAGFDLSVRPDRWQLYLEGVEQAIIVGPNGEFVEFYGRGFDSPESDTRVYYLVSGTTAGKRIQTRAVQRSSKGVAASGYLQAFLVKERLTYISNVLNGDVENYWGSPIMFTGDTNFRFTLSGVDFTAPNATIELSFQGFTTAPHIVGVKLNGKPLESATGKARDPFSKTYTVPTKFLKQGENRLTLRSQGGPKDTSLVDSVGVTFGRKFLASENRLSFFTPDNRRVRLAGFSSRNVRVFDITADGSPALLKNLSAVKSGATFGVALPADRGRAMFAVEDSGVLSPAAVTQHRPATLSQADHAADLVIISNSRFMQEAEAWAEYRRGQGFAVKIVDISEIFDEFSYGILDSEAIKKFLQYTYENLQTAPSYVLLLGDASYDSKNYEGRGYNNLVPTKIVNMIYGESGSDELLGDFDDDGLAEMAIGRIPAREPKAVATALAKVKVWERTMPTLQNQGVLFVFDQSKDGNDFPAFDRKLKDQITGPANATTIGRVDPVAPPATAQSRVLSSINAGKFLVNYTGHGLARSWADPSFFSDRHVPQLTNAANPSIFTMFSCLNAYFMNASETSLAEALLEAPNGGAVAVWASTAETTSIDQEKMAQRFFRQISSGKFQRLGDLIRDAKTVIPKNDVRLSWVLLGDPMLKIR